MSVVRRWLFDFKGPPLTSVRALFKRLLTAGPFSRPIFRNAEKEIQSQSKLVTINLGYCQIWLQSNLLTTKLAYNTVKLVSVKFGYYQTKMYCYSF